MSITAVSGVKLTNNAYNTVFTGKRRNTESEVAQRDGGGGSAMKRVPVVVMLAMSPAMLNSSVPEQYMPMNAQELTEVVAQIPAEDAATVDFREVQETQQNYPLGVAFFNRFKIQEIIPAVVGGAKANIVFTKPVKIGADRDVYDVYYVDPSEPDSNPRHKPPEIRELIYHNLGEGKEFIGIKLFHHLYKKDGSEVGMISELKVDDKTAQYLLDLRTGDTKWNNKTLIGFSVTQSPNVLPPRVLE